MLRALRLSNKLTLEDVAEILNKSKQEVFKWETKFNPSDEMIEKLIDHLNSSKHPVN